MKEIKLVDQHLDIKTANELSSHRSLAMLTLENCFLGPNFVKALFFFDGDDPEFLPELREVRLKRMPSLSGGDGLSRLRRVTSDHSPLLRIVGFDSA